MADPEEDRSPHQRHSVSVTGCLILPYAYSEGSCTKLQAELTVRYKKELRFRGGGFGLSLVPAVDSAADSARHTLTDTWM